jgi:hypothetical protein
MGKENRGKGEQKWIEETTFSISTIPFFRYLFFISFRSSPFSTSQVQLLLPLFSLPFYRVQFHIIIRQITLEREHW